MPSMTIEPFARNPTAINTALCCPLRLQSASDFYRWLGELEAARSSETEEKFRKWVLARLHVL